MRVRKRLEFLMRRGLRTIGLGAQGVNRPSLVTGELVGKIVLRGVKPTNYLRGIRCTLVCWKQPSDMTTKQTILTWLELNPGMHRTREISAKLGVPSRHVSVFLCTLYRDGLIQKGGVGIHMKYWAGTPPKDEREYPFTLPEDLWRGWNGAPVLGLKGWVRS